MSHLVFVILLHLTAIVAATAAGALLVSLCNWRESKSMNVRSRVQRRFVKRELSLPQTMAAAATKQKVPIKLQSLRLMAKTVR